MVNVLAVYLYEYVLRSLLVAYCGGRCFLQVWSACSNKERLLSFLRSQHFERWHKRRYLESKDLSDSDSSVLSHLRICHYLSPKYISLIVSCDKSTLCLFWIIEWYCGCRLGTPSHFSFVALCLFLSTNVHF